MATTTGTATRTALLSEQVLAYTKAHDPQLLPFLMGRGVVLAGTKSMATAAKIVNRNSGVPLLVDPAIYETAMAADLATTPKQLTLDGSPPWLAQQAALNVDIVLSPTGLVRWPQRDELRGAVDHGVICCEAASPRRAALVLALDGRWLARSVDEVVEALDGVDLPVALVLSDPYDPLSHRAALHGLLHLIGSIDTLMLLRTDLHALGAIAHGAAAAAIGTNPTLRHLHPPRRSGRGGATVKDVSPSVLVRTLGRYARGSWLQQVEQDDGLLNCPLEECCDGQPLQRFGAPDEHGTLPLEAVFHNAAVTKALAAEVLDLPASKRPAAWSNFCRDAHNANEELYGRTGIRKLRPPGYLAAWGEL